MSDWAPKDAPECPRRNTSSPRACYVQGFVRGRLSSSRPQPYGAHTLDGFVQLKESTLYPTLSKVRAFYALALYTDDIFIH